MSAATGRRANRWVWLWGIAYAALLGTVVWSLFAARKSALAELDNSKSRSDWQTWRDDVRQQQSQAAPGPVQRHVPKSAEPPALVLMRDYFGVSLAGAVLFSTVLYWIIAWLVMGILCQSPSRNRLEERSFAP